MLGRQAIAGDRIAGSLPGESGVRLRLDPFAFPVRYSAKLAGRAPESAVLLDRHQAVINRPLPGTTMSVTVPVAEYRGVAVRFEAGKDDGDVTVIVELRHADPALSLPLAIADDPAEIAADWQAYGRAFALPLLLVRADGSIEEPVARMGALAVRAAAPRRRHSYFAARRPRFLVRRKPGGEATSQRVEGCELIARD